MPSGVAEPAAVEEVRGMRTCSAGDGERWCAPTLAEDANGAASAGLTSGERFGLPEELRNRYVLLRHGRSLANERGLIVSSLVRRALRAAPSFRPPFPQLCPSVPPTTHLPPPEALPPFPLVTCETLFPRWTPLWLLEQRGVAGRDVVVMASPFSRTQQTAALSAAELGIDVLGTRFQTAEELRERYFGHHLELNSHDLYPAVWVDDKKDAAFRPGGDGESVLAVAQRTARLIQHIEEAVDG
ncbi:unnamed protein product [Closterium sp. Naga37s-1]|nr:unnamed protein product [Closterium sp. Naga37s-1]